MIVRSNGGPGSLGLSPGLAIVSGVTLGKCLYKVGIIFIS